MGRASDNASPAVAIHPYGQRLGLMPGQIPTNQLIWPLGMPSRLQGATLADLLPNDHLLLFPCRSHYLRPNFGTLAKVSVVIVEPEIIHARHIRGLKTAHHRFWRILTAVDHLIDAVPNGIMFPFGSTRVPSWRDINVTKSRMTSLIASAKKFLPLHHYRHTMADWIQRQNLDIDVMGGGYQPFANKSEGLASYRFSIVIENAIQPNYFTEKLIDAILCETIPIYLGCPNIERFIDPKGMVVCKTMSDLSRAVCSVSGELYAERLCWLLHIKGQAAYYADFHERAAKTLLAEDRENRKSLRPFA